MLFFLAGTGLKADIATVLLSQPNGFVSPSQAIDIAVLVTNSIDSTSDVVSVQDTTFDFFLGFPTGPPLFDVSYFGFAPAANVDIAPGDSETLDAAVYNPEAPTALDGMVFNPVVVDVQVIFADGSSVDVDPGEFSRTISSLPEPSSYILLGSVLLALVARLCCTKPTMATPRRPGRNDEKQRGKSAVVTAGMNSIRPSNALSPLGPAIKQGLPPRVTAREELGLVAGKNGPGLC
jgi:hypothetical protein